MATDAAPRRQTKPPDERRQEILGAALRLFHDRGFDATTVQDIARAAGVAAGTVYLYFPSKEHVLLGLHDRFHAGMQAQMEQAGAAATDTVLVGGGDYGLGIDAIVDAVVAFCVEHQVETTVICRFLPRMHDWPHASDELSTFVGMTIRQGVEAGRIHTTDPQMAGRILVAALRGPLIEAIVTGHPDDIPRLAQQAKEVFRKALAPPADA